jgi:hypothetical protein
MSLLMDYDNNKTPYLDSVLDSSFNYMDNGLDYLQLPHDQSPLDVNVGLPATGSPMDFGMPMTEYSYASPCFSAPSPPHSYTPPEEVSSPSLVPYNLNGPELSESIPSAMINRGSRSPPAVPYSATVPRSHRFNPIAVPPSRTTAKAAHKRRQSRQSNDESDDDDEDFTPGSSSNSGTGEAASRDSRRETVRKQRIESEQRRRDELREGYARLKETLPASNQKASKVSLLDRATSHIKYLEAVKDQLEARLKGADTEVHRLRSVNEALMLNRAGAAAAAAALVASRKFGGKGMPMQQQMS